MYKILALIIMMPFSQNIFSQSLSKIEKQIITYINLHVSDAEKLLENIVNINSGTLNKEGVKKVGEIFSSEFKKAGFSTEWVLLPDSLNRAGHLVATIKGKKGKKYL